MSSLTRKYRDDLDLDEDLLIGDTGPTAIDPSIAAARLNGHRRTLDRGLNPIRDHADAGNPPRRGGGRRVATGNTVANNIIEKMMHANGHATSTAATSVTGATTTSTNGATVEGFLFKAVDATKVNQDMAAVAAAAAASMKVKKSSSSKSNANSNNNETTMTTAKRRVPSYSRFPSRWSDAVDQMCGAVAHAIAQGHDRVCVDIANPATFPANACDEVLRADTGSENRTATQVTKAAVQLLSNLLETCARAKHPPRGTTAHQTRMNDSESSTTKTTTSTSCDNSLPSSSSSSSPSLSSLSDRLPSSPAPAAVTAREKALIEVLTPRDVLLLFNDAADLAACASLVPHRLSGRRVTVGVLGEIDSTRFVGSLVVVVCANNTHGNPSHIEAVEHVHYSNFNRRNWVVMFNADLVSLSLASVAAAPRPPLFLADYCHAYHADPVALPCAFGGAGALLRTYPRKWELYLDRRTMTSAPGGQGQGQQAGFSGGGGGGSGVQQQQQDEHLLLRLSNQGAQVRQAGSWTDRRAGVATTTTGSGGGLRLVSEHKQRPSRDRIQCELLWRIERDVVSVERSNLRQR